MRRDLVHQREMRDALKEQRLDRAHAGIGVKIFLDGIAVEEVDERQESHSFMMGHICPHDRTPGPFAVRLMIEVHRFIVAEIIQHPQTGEPFQISDGLLRCECNRQKCGVGRDDDLIDLTPFEPEFRHPERAVLIGSVHIKVTIRRLRDAPRHAVLAAVSNLDCDGVAGRLVQQRVCKRTLEKKGHQIFEHRAGPAEQHLAPADGAVRPAHGKPVLGGNVPPRDCDEAPQARLACQEVVKSVIQPTFRDIIADRE